MTVLSLRALNRATLARQWLLERRPASALEAIEQLVGMQSQAALAPYTGLWTRLVDFDPSELVELMHNRSVVRLSLMRSTIHLISADDALGIYPLLRSVHSRGLASNQQLAPLRATLDLDALGAAGRRLLSASPLSGPELGAALAEEFPGHEPSDLSRAVRDLLAGVQVPPRGIWGKGGQPVTTTLESWLDRPLTPYALETLVLRYLAAFGPATPMDMQQWSGLTHLTEIFDRLRPRLRTYTVEGTTRKVFDLESITLPDSDTPAPIRFMTEFDNLLIGYADRTRVLPEEHRRHVFTNNGIIKPTLLLNGTTTATWKPTVTKSTARLTITPLAPIPKRHHPAIESEAHELLAFLAPTAEAHEIEFVSAP
ncbi:MAG TPA: winged helix DNA-binding domain-containing protein [Kribbella sp.]